MPDGPDALDQAGVRKTHLRVSACHMKDPKSHTSVWAEMPFMVGPKGADRLRELSGNLADGRRQAEARRQRVLAHDWARKRLCQIFHYSSAENWNGYVPPLHDPDGELNTSDYRRALVELLRDVAS